MFHFDLFSLIQTIGYLGIFAIIFVETGLPIGFFLPGDSLLFTAGILAAEGFLDVRLIIALIAIAGIIGNNVGYAIGRKLGPRLFSKEESLLFNKKHIDKTEAFYHKHGPKTLLLARFIPVVRTFAGIFAGVGKMQYSTFMFYNVLGGVLWSFLITSLGYFLGRLVDNIEVYIIPGILLIILLSLAPYMKPFITNPEVRKQTYHHIGRMKDRILRK